MFELVGLGRIKGIVGPTLLVPLFSARTSNHTFIHVLDKSHSIRRFQRCNTAYFDVMSHHHKGIFDESSAGLFGFDLGEEKLFVGTHDELTRMWDEFSTKIKPGSLIRAIIVEILSTDPVVKYTSWRDYASQNSTTSDELTELLSSKLEFFQTLDQFWLELEEERREQEESAEDLYRVIVSWNEIDILNWLRDPASYRHIVWSWVWEHSDRVFLNTDQSQEILMGYIECMADEYPEFSDANFAYIVKRATSFDALSAREKEVFREYFMSNLPARKRSRIDPKSFESMVRKLYEGEEQVSIVDMIKMLGDITRFVMGYSATDVKHDQIDDLTVIGEIDYDIVTELLKGVEARLSGSTITHEEIRVIVLFYIHVILPAQEERRCVPLVNAILKCFNINSEIIELHCRAGSFDLQAIMDAVVLRR